MEERRDGNAFILDNCDFDVPDELARIAAHSLFQVHWAVTLPRRALHS